MSGWLADHGSKSRTVATLPMRMVIVDREIRLLARGHTDESAGRQLAISTRSGQRLMTPLTERLSAASRFQAGSIYPTQGRRRRIDTWRPKACGRVRDRHAYGSDQRRIG